ncbi:MAG: TraR/DksA C4-type zinc finger protein [Caldilineaceae bacterium]|nr:TraR/DksA C4-type zinc finger protein [Caldilineaceae bacterium]
MMKNQTDLTITHQKKLRRRLLAEQSTLEQKIATRRNTEENDPRNNLDRGDLARDVSALDRRMALLDIEEELLAQVQAALQRMDAGTYGICTQCGRAIDPQRLEALPHAALCMDCHTAG